MNRSSTEKHADLPGDPFRQRLQALAALEAEDAIQLRALTTEAGIRIFEDLLDAGFEMIHDMIEQERRKGGDADKLARFLLQDEHGE